MPSWVFRYVYLCGGCFGSHRSCGVAILYRPFLLFNSVVCEFDAHFVSLVNMSQMVTLSVIPFFISVWIILTILLLPSCVATLILFSTVLLIIVGPAPWILLVRVAPRAIAARLLKVIHLVFGSLLSSDRSICEVFNVYSLYDCGSRAKLNMSKCKGL